MITITSSYVTIYNFRIQNSSRSGIWSNDCGILIGGHYCNIYNNILSNDTLGIRINQPDYQRIHHNFLEGGDRLNGITVSKSYMSVVENNTINAGGRIYVHFSNNNIITNNTIINSYIYVQSSNSNNIYHNNFIDITWSSDTGVNSWDNGYPSGGNFWSDYNGSDNYSGPNQDINGSDGIGDTEYIIDADSNDSYPLMEPWFLLDIQPPTHSNEIPSIDGYTIDSTPTISVHVTDLSGVESNTVRLYVSGYSVFYDLVQIPDGYNVSYWHQNGFPPGDVVTCRIKAKDVHGNLLDFTWFFTVLESYNVSLNLGWNLISLPLEQGDESICEALSSIDGKWDYIQAYNALDPDHWKTNATFKPGQLNDLQFLNHQMGFWINIIELNVTLTVSGYIPVSTSIPLYTGWNLIGYPSLANETVANAFWGTGADKVEVFDPGEPYLIREVGPTYLMKPGEGYWVHVPADTVWVVDW